MSSYVPNYLVFLSQSGTMDGWPKGIDDAGKLFAIDRVKAGLEKYGQLDLDTAKRCIYDHYIDKEPVPECLKGVAWDWLYAVTFRALSAVHAKQVFVLEPGYSKKVKTKKEWRTFPVSRADVEALEVAGKVTVGVTGQRIRELATTFGQIVK